MVYREWLPNSEDNSMLSWELDLEDNFIAIGIVEEMDYVDVAVMDLVTRFIRLYEDAGVLFDTVTCIIDAYDIRMIWLSCVTDGMGAKKDTFKEIKDNWCKCLENNMT